MKGVSFGARPEFQVKTGRQHGATVEIVDGNGHGMKHRWKQD